MSNSGESFRKFLLLWSGQFISAMGSGLTSFGLGVYVFQQTGKASAMALVTLLAFMPALLLSAVAGVLADRYDRRLLMVLGDSLSAVGLVFILICMLGGEAQLWQICVGVTISSVFSSLLEPAYKATVTDLLTEEQYTKASGLVQMAGSAKYLISPVMAGFLLTVSNIKLLLVIDILTFFITVAATTEYLIEFRLKDLSELGAFEIAYTSAGLEANGPTITYPLFKMLNALSDGMLAAIILLISALVVAMAVMCIRFTLLTKIEDDYREIGVMKAMGLPISHIKKLYLAKYAAIALVGCMLGLAMSFAVRGMLLENIRLYMGESASSSGALFFGITGVLLVLLVIIVYVNGVLRRFRKISAAEAIRLGISREKPAGIKHFCLSGNRLLGTNVFLGIKDVLARKSLYATMLAVLVLAAFIIIVPQNLYNTISAKSFSTYLGIGNSDLRIDIQQTDNISGKATEIVKMMNSDSAISQYAMLTTKTFKAMRGNGAEERIKIELGDHSLFPVEYSEGRAPLEADEIALSTINADELGKKAGDFITLAVEGEEKKLTVCGIYSDITNGGKTAKAVFTDNSAKIMGCVISARLTDRNLVGRKASEYGDRFDFAKVSSIEEYIAQTFGATMSSVAKASSAATTVALLITALVTLLFMKMLMAKDRYSIAVMKALGLTNWDIRLQYIARSVFVLAMGIVLGTLLANTLGEVLAGAAISSFGASSFRFVVNPFSAYLLCPLMMICAVLMATIVGTSGAGQIKISENIKE